jgi:Brp/Blh family beta-carotene 15,15'-monooxygenase
MSVNKQTPIQPINSEKTGISGRQNSGKLSYETIILLALTCFLLLLNFDSSLQWNIGFIIVIIGLITIGIPHGAVDYLLDTGNWNTKTSSLFILRYLMMGGLMGLGWYLIPQLAILFFLSYSAWHFGQADGIHWQFKSWQAHLWGASVLFFILCTHSTETNEILTAMGNKIQLPGCPWYSMIPWIIYSFYKKNYPLLITVFWISLTSQLPLIFSFSLYFIGQHSWISWNHIQTRLQISNKKIWLRSLPFHAGGWILLGLFLKYWTPAITDHPAQMWSTFFIFVGCISFPHVVSMNSMYLKMNQLFVKEHKQAV